MERIFCIIHYFQFVLQLSGDVAANSLDIRMELCSIQTMTSVCDVICARKNYLNSHISFWHRDEFGDTEEVCSTTEIRNSSHCESSAYSITKFSSSSAVMRIHVLQFNDYGHWYCKDEFATSEEHLLDPIYLETENISATFTVGGYRKVPYTLVNVSEKPSLNEYDVIGVWGFDLEIQVNIPCAYPRPKVTVEIQTEKKSCIVSNAMWTVQYVEACKVQGHIGSYNYTYNLLRNVHGWNVCFFLMSRIGIAVFQNGIQSAKRIYVKEIQDNSGKDSEENIISRLPNSLLTTYHFLGPIVLFFICYVLFYNSKINNEVLSKAKENIRRSKEKQHCNQRMKPSTNNEEYQGIILLLVVGIFRITYQFLYDDRGFTYFKDRTYNEHRTK